MVSYKPRLFSSDDQTQDAPPPEKLDGRPVADVEDVPNEELKSLIEKYLEGDEKVLPSVVEAVMRRGLTGKHEDTDDELMEKLRYRPVKDMNPQGIDDDLSEAAVTDDEIEDLYNARDIVMKKMGSDEYFNMDDHKWDEMIREATEQGYLKDTRECENILEDMLCWDKLLPDEVKRKVEEKFNELGDMCERKEIEPEEAYERFKVFEEKLVADHVKNMEEEHEESHEGIVGDGKDVESDDPPGEGPILRWVTRVVLGPGGDAWHPKNRKVKLSVTVKELGLSKYQFRRMRELVGKRYNCGKDELTITSERFEHREENRKDCLRTLFSVIEEAGKADELAEEARVSFLKDRLRLNPSFMDRLRARSIPSQGSNA